MNHRQMNTADLRKASKARAAKGIPLLHVDLHGKVSEKLHLDLGAAPLEEVGLPRKSSWCRALGCLRDNVQVVHFGKPNLSFESRSGQPRIKAS